MVASDFEYRYRFWMILAIYAAAYSLYNVNHLNILYSLVPWNRGVLSTDIFVRFLYGGAALLAAAGSFLLTWSTAYRPPRVDGQLTPFLVGGPFRFVRNPQYLSYFLLVLALGTFQSVLGFPVMLLGETLLLFRLAAREELLLKEEHGDLFRRYAQCVPGFLPALRPRIEDDGQRPRWREALWEQAFQWGFVATLLAFALTLSDPIGYALGGATIAFLLLQKLSQLFWIRPRRA